MKISKKKELAIIQINHFVTEQGTLIQDEIFPNELVHHLTSKNNFINNQVIIYIGKDSVFCENGKKYDYIDMSKKEIESIINLL